MAPVLIMLSLLKSNRMPTWSHPSWENNGLNVFSFDLCDDTGFHTETRIPNVIFRSSELSRWAENTQYRFKISNTRYSTLCILDLFHDFLCQARFDLRFWCPTSRSVRILLKDSLRNMTWPQSKNSMAPVVKGRKRNRNWVMPMDKDKGNIG